MAKNKAIQNIPLEELEITQPIIKDEKGRYSLDFYESNDLKKIEEGVRETQKGIQTASLAIALAIARIDKEALYIQAISFSTHEKYKTYTEYLREADNRLNMPKQTISDLKKIGETYLKNRSSLQKIGFEEEGNLHKLRYLNQALQKHNAKEVFQRLKSDSFRNFKEYAESERSDSRRREPQDYTINASKRGIILDGEPVLTFSPELDETERKGIASAVKEYYRTSKRNLRTVSFEIESEEEEKELAKYLRSINKIKEAKDIPCIIGVYDEGEEKAVKRKINTFLKEYRARK